MTNQRSGQRGQALLLVTFALIAMCGLLGLAVDLGWAYFVKKSAQASADAGAMAAAQNILSQVHQTQPITGKMAPSGSSPCTEPPSGIYASGCAYAQQSGFGGTISMTSGTAASPTVLNLVSSYWVTARAVQIIPQLFSAVLGNPTGVSSARASAAIVTENINGALHTLNRQYDLIAASGLPQGADIGGSGQITVPSGVVMSSQSASAGSGSSVTGPITIVSPGNASGLGASPITEIGDSGTFLDPYRDIPSPGNQPALPGTTNGGAALPTYGVANGNLVNGGVFLLIGTTIQAVVPPPYPSGNYVPITCNPACASGGTAILDTVDQLTLVQSATFSDLTPTCYPGTGNTFGCFFFYGGITVSGATMTMGAGEFVMVGGGAAGRDLVVTSSAFLDSLVSCPNPSNLACAAAGVILIMTGSSSPVTCGASVCVNSNGDLYPNLEHQITGNPLLLQAASAGLLNFGSVSLLAGADNAGAAVTGLIARNLPSSVDLANTLTPFDGVVLWQDQANSTIEYNTAPALGNINTTCSGGNIDNPCTKTLPVFGSEGMTLQAPANTGIEGIVYQPRGAFLQTGGGTIQGPIQIITGAISMQGGGTINLTNKLTANGMPPTSAKRRVVALVE
jgi:Putative Flp pilus-assembly TadE/G-like